LKTPCEIIVGRILPTIRGEVVRLLSSKYGMKQTEISKALGITQASVSQYLSNDRGTDAEIMKIFPEVAECASEIALGISKGTARDAQISLMCAACMKIRGEKSFCKFHREAIGLEECKICKG
jgi:predicted transcriptional regulator